MKEILRKFYDSEIKNIRNELVDHENNIFICGMDNFILEIIIDDIVDEFKKKKYEVVNFTSCVEKTTEHVNTLFLADITEFTSLSKNSSLYFILEICNTNKNKCILYSTSCVSVDTLERRVKSRFSKSTFLLEPLDFKSYCNVYKKIAFQDNISVVKIKKSEKIRNVQNTVRQTDKKDRSKEKLVSEDKLNSIVKNHLINSTLESFYEKSVLDRLTHLYNIDCSMQRLFLFYKQVKYNLPMLTLENIMNILSNIHIAILLLCNNRRIVYSNVQREFRKFVSGFKELKNVKDNEILFYFLDLIDFDFIDEKGNFLLPFENLKEYIMDHSPSYIKNLCRASEKKMF